jgi:hypothetical protein
MKRRLSYINPEQTPPPIVPHRRLTIQRARLQNAADIVSPHHAKLSRGSKSLPNQIASCPHESATATIPHTSCGLT